MPYHDAFPELVADIRGLPDLMLDGELVMLDGEGRAQFGDLVRRSRPTKSISVKAAAQSRPAASFAFDSLELYGHDMREIPLLER
jgi:bifunctional non-homologous end joining protein LigD